MIQKVLYLASYFVMGAACTWNAYFAIFGALVDAGVFRWTSEADVIAVRVVTMCVLYRVL